AIPTPQRLSFIEVVAPFLALANAPGITPELINTTLQDALLQSVLHMTVASDVSLQSPSKTERTRALQVCNQARDFVSAQFATGTVPTIVDVCSALGVSERTLQYAFRAYVDMSPLAYLRMCRLNSVRNALQASHRSAHNVTAVAMHFGFLHLGRFALDYKRAFGESPSHTLASSVSENG
ncbi:MAG TPA: hypothetical protein DIS96_09030, partial [Pusillimonas sp.]|nr:hypothetical protein [Pusillimonas sp.]